MLSIVRTETIVETREYILDLDKEYMDFLNEFLHKQFVINTDVTSEDLAQLFDYGVETDNIDIMVKSAVYFEDGVAVEYYLPDVLRDFIEDDIWDRDPEPVYFETTDTYTEVIER